LPTRDDARPPRVIETRGRATGGYALGVGPEPAARAAAGCARDRHILSDVTALRDIAEREDCERLVRAFYGKALTDPIIGWLFTDIARLDLDTHAPKIASFWETVLLGAHSYRGGAFAPHAALHMKAPLRRGHFERWLWLWHATVDELFAGVRAELAKSHANRVASAFHGRLEAMSAAMAAPSGGLVVTQHG
jgi:hemoglobin